MKKWVKQLQAAALEPGRPCWCNYLPDDAYGKYVPGNVLLAYTDDEHLRWFLLFICAAEAS